MYEFDELEVKLNGQCSAHVRGKAFYDAEWKDGATSTHYGTINKGLELSNVEFEKVEIQGYVIAIHIKDEEWIHGADIDCLRLDNDSTKEMIEKLETEIKEKGLLDQELWDHANGQGVPERC